MINIGDWNKKYFKHGEDVNLVVEVKNIQKLTVKVFELQTENYYRKHMKQVE